MVCECHLHFVDAVRLCYILHTYDSARYPSEHELCFGKDRFISYSDLLLTAGCTGHHWGRGYFNWCMVYCQVNVQHQ